MKKTILACCLFFAFQSYSIASENTGIITALNLNSAVTDRGPCVQMTPAIVSSSQWGCLFNPSSHLFKEMTSLLTASFIAHNACRIVWTEEISGHAHVTMIECTN